MYGRVHGINNSAANFLLSRPIRFASVGWFMGRDKQHMQAINDEPNERGQSSIASESTQPSKHTCPSHHNRTCDCPSGNCADNDGECGTCKCFNCNCEQDGNLPSQHSDSCTCPVCRDYNDYTTAIISPQRERTSTGIWIGNELRAAEYTNTDAANSIEYITGLSAGDAV